MPPSESGTNVPEPVQRTVLEHLLYSVVREGTTHEKADRAFQTLKDRFVDWNEVRVSTVQELCDAMGPLPDVATRGAADHRHLARVVRADLLLRHGRGRQEGAQGRSQEGFPAQRLERLLGRLGRAERARWPRDPTRRAVDPGPPPPRVLDGESESLESLRGTIEHFVPKAKGPAFVELLSEHADVLCTEENPRCSNVRCWTTVRPDKSGSARSRAGRGSRGRASVSLAPISGQAGRLPYGRPLVAIPSAAG